MRAVVECGRLSVTWAAPTADAAAYAHARIFLAGPAGEPDLLGVIAPGATLVVGAHMDTVKGSPAPVEVRRVVGR